MPKESKTVKLQKRFAYNYKGREHFKHVLTVPEHVIHELGWEEGTELRPDVKSGKLLFERYSQNREEELWNHKSGSALRTFLLRCHRWLGGESDQ